MILFLNPAGPVKVGPDRFEIAAYLWPNPATERWSPTRRAAGL